MVKKSNYYRERERYHAILSLCRSSRSVRKRRSFWWSSRLCFGHGDDDGLRAAVVVLGGAAGVNDRGEGEGREKGERGEREKGKGTRLRQRRREPFYENKARILYVYM